jgi:subfamily B ATP-binding cassette protein MsbA
MAEPVKKPKLNLANVRAEARTLVWEHRRSLMIGMGLMVIARVAGLVLPFSTKYFIDEVLNKGRSELLTTIVLATAAATLIQAIIGYSLSQIVSVAAQGAIATMRKRVQQHVLRLPVSYFDSTKSGVLISRIMNDPEGIRNLVGTGLLQLVGGLMTATIIFIILLYRNWLLTLATLGFLIVFAVSMAIAFKKLRPVFRKRGEINAEVTGRLGEALGGVRLVKIYVAENREERTFGEGVDRLFKNIASTITGTSLISAISTAIVGGISVIIMVVGGHAVLNQTMTQGDLVSYVVFVGMMVAPLVQIASIGTQITEAFAGLDRIHEIRQIATEDQEDETREPLRELDGEVRFHNVSFEYKTGTPVLNNISFQAEAERRPRWSALPAQARAHSSG